MPHSKATMETLVLKWQLGKVRDAEKKGGKRPPWHFSPVNASNNLRIDLTSIQVAYVNTDFWLVYLSNTSL